MILITTYYKPNNEERLNELNQCLINNFNNNFIKKIYLLNDKIYDLSFINYCENKITQIIVNEENNDRLGYDYAIDFINNNLEGNICILCNSDIFFDDSLEKLVDYNFDNKMLALARYNNNILFNKIDSQDSWIFKSKAKIDLSLCKFKFGKPCCDNRIACIFKDHGYNVINPSLTIKSHHLHNSNFRTYDKKDKVTGDYFFIKPSIL